MGGLYSDLEYNNTKYPERQTKLKLHSTKFKAQHLS
jgi:hypothetical protein